VKPKAKQVRIALMAALSLFVSQVGAEEALPWLELELGRYWEFEDDSGRMRITIAAEEKVGDIAAFRVEWSTGGTLYQAELWATAPEDSGILAVGRIIGGRTFLFETPYLLLKNPLSPGQTWQAEISVPAANFKDTLACSVAEKDDTIETAIGEFEARKVVVEGRALTYHRWYARGVGLVQEAGYRGGQLMNQKTLSKTGITGEAEESDASPTAAGQ
jgi:hypothetical protein